MASAHVSLLLRNLEHRGYDDESSSDDEEYEYESEGEGGSQYQSSADLPMHFLGVHLHRNPNKYNTTSDAERNSSHEPSADDGVAATSATAATSTTPHRPPPTTPTLASTPSTTTWRNSKERQEIINELKDPLSNIHLMIGRYAENDFSSVNFRKILQDYAGNKFKLSNFKVNLKLQLTHSLNKTGAFKAESTSPWYTSTNNVSRAYSLLFMLYMDKSKSQTVRSMSDEEVWKSYPQFQVYELKKFKTHNKNMKILTRLGTELVEKEELSYQRDFLSMSSQIDRDVPLWNTHDASDILQKHVADEVCGIIDKTTPQKLWKSQEEYQDFPLRIFRKHIYQERQKQLAAPFWQHKRNANAQKKFEEVDVMLREWAQTQFNTKVDALATEVDQINLDDNTF